MSYIFKETEALTERLGGYKKNIERGREVSRWRDVGREREREREKEVER